MTEDQHAMAIHLGACRFLPASFDKRFARDMWAIAAENPEKELTEKQHTYLCRAVYKYRRQIPKDVVNIAEKYIDPEAA